MNLVELSSEAEHLKYPPDSLTTVLYEDELESVSSKVFSDEIVSKKYEISKDELEAIKNPTIKLSYFLTDDENIEEEGEVSFPELNTLFVKFHGINDDL